MREQFANIIRPTINGEPGWSIANHLSIDRSDYNVVVTDADGEPVENVELPLFDQDYAVVLNSTANRIGWANLNLTFSDGNYTDSSELGSFKEGFFNATIT